jgi:thioredoxin 1
MTFQEIIQGETPVLVDFFATWCQPCQVLAPTLEQLAARHEITLRILKVDVDKNSAAAANYQVSGVPTLILFKQGKAVWRQSGALSLHAIEQALAPHLAE